MNLAMEFMVRPTFWRQEAVAFNVDIVVILAESIFRPGQKCES